MAKFLSQVYTTIRGSVGGITYTANQFQALVARARVSPTDPQSTFQSQMRSAFAGAEQLWQNLTAAQRTGWQDYASSLVHTGPTGTYFVPGRQVFIGIMSTAIYLKNRGASIGALTGTPPTIPGFLDVDNVTTATPSVAGDTSVSFGMTFNGVEDVVAYAYRSPAQNQSRNSYKRAYSSSTLNAIDIVAPASIIGNFLGLTADLAYFMKIRAITAQAPYRQSATYYLRQVAVAVP